MGGAARYHGRVTSRAPLKERLGVEVSPALWHALLTHLDEARETGLEALVASGQIPARFDPRWADLALPRSVLEVLVVAVADARARGLTDHADALVRIYLETMPQARLMQLLADRAPHRWLFHEAVPWSELPRFRSALDRLFALVVRCGLDPSVLGAPDPDAWLAARPTLADLYVGTYYGRLQPMFGATEHDLRRLAAEVSADPTHRWHIVDRRLGHALVHELLHFGPDREAIFPPYLDEAIAAHLQLLIDEGVAFPAPGEDSALIGWPWFSQVGSALARVVGDGPLLAAQAGLVPWSEVIPEPLLSRLERDAWAAYQAAPAVHFHPDTTRPDRWVRLIYQMVPPRPDPVRDHVMLVHALTSTCLHSAQHEGAWCVTRRAPDGLVAIDFEAGVVRAPPRADGCELAPMLHALPASLIGPHPDLVVEVDPAPEAIEALTARIFRDLGVPSEA